MAVLRKARRPARGARDAASYRHVKVADAAAGHLADALVRLFAELGRAFNAARAAELAGSSPALVAGMTAPTVPIGKRVTSTDIEDILADVVEGGAAGFSTSFNLRRDQSVAYARQRSAELVTAIDNDTRQAIADIITRGQEGGLTWEQMARQIRPLIGLTPAQAAAAGRYRQALQRRLDGAHYGAEAADALAAQFGLSTWRGGRLTVQRIDDLYRRYVDRHLRHRAETIARTETIRAASAGEMAAWQDTIAEGGADGYIVVREWSVTRDDRACRRCLALDGEKRTTAPVSEGHRPDLGSQLFEGVPHPPLHPRCRCVILTTMELVDPAESLIP